MISTFKDKKTAAFASGEFTREFSGFDRQAYKRLEILGAATSLDDLRTLPSNRLEALRGDRAGQYSIRINPAMAALLRVATGCPRAVKRRNNGLSLMEE